ncbi:MAG: hypothetical protein H6R12_2695 [Proteobacteria bacterium]|nr:hypothetical protein [Pseudomonadota bacterium]
MAVASVTSPRAALRPHERGGAELRDAQPPVHPAAAVQRGRPRRPAGADRGEPRRPRAAVPPAHPGRAPHRAARGDLRRAGVAARARGSPLLDGLPPPRHRELVRRADRRGHGAGARAQPFVAQPAAARPAARDRAAAAEPARGGGRAEPRRARRRAAPPVGRDRADAAEPGRHRGDPSAGAGRARPGRLRPLPGARLPARVADVQLLAHAAARAAVQLLRGALDRLRRLRRAISTPSCRSRASRTRWPRWWARSTR